jgi:hypothetical protein
MQTLTTALELVGLALVAVAALVAVGVALCLFVAGCELVFVGYMLGRTR